MNKFPVLSVMRGIYLLIALIIGFGGGFGAIWTAQMMGGESGYRDPNVGAGVIVFVLSLIGSASFVVFGEIISLSLRVEDHLEKMLIIMEQTSINNQKVVYRQAVKNHNSMLSQSNISDSPDNVVDSLEIPVQTHNLSLYRQPSPTSEIVTTLTGIKSVIATQRHSSGGWVFAGTLSQSGKVYGWVKVIELNTSFSQIKALPVIKE